MAHVAKVKSSGVYPMVGHYAREAEARGYVRDNIDNSRTHLNYEICSRSRGPLESQVRDRVREAIETHERTAGKALRRDANVLMDWVVTLPKDCPEDKSRDFFLAAVRFVRGRYGADNVPGGFVHMDEATPHVHIPVVPMLDGRLQASKVVCRADLKTFHKALSAAEDKALGFHVSVELDESQKGAKQLSALSQDEYKAAKDELAAAKAESRRMALKRDGLRDELAAADAECGRRMAEAARASQRADEAERALQSARDAQRAAEGATAAQRADLERLRGETRAERERLECVQQEHRGALEGLESFEAKGLGELLELAASRGAGARERAAEQANERAREGARRAAGQVAKARALLEALWERVRAALGGFGETVRHALAARPGGGSEAFWKGRQYVRGKAKSEDLEDLEEKRDVSRERPAQTRVPERTSTRGESWQR